MAENLDRVNQGFRVLVKILAPYVAQELQRQYKAGWWRDGVLKVLNDNQSRDLPTSGETAQMVDSLDIQRSLALIDLQWSTVFRTRMSNDQRNWVKELQNTRNKVAHAGSLDLNEDDAWRAVDTMARLSEHIDADATDELRAIAREIRYGHEDGSTAGTTVTTAPVKPTRTGVITTAPQGALKSWRDIIEPHPDVAKGEYKNAEFAADLHQVAQGKGSIEYLDPVEFFARTYLTEGLKNFLITALRRVSGKDGDPVIQLKTVFGGGKTHSMLALYHLLKGQVPLSRIEAYVRPVLQGAGISTLIKTRIAVIVGTAIDPSKSRRPANFPGMTINTVWGEIAAQLAESAGNLKLYDIVREADRKGVSPGSEAFRQLFDACGPCLVLMDELVSYAKKLQGRTDLPAGNLDNFIAFIQEISEGARASKNSLIVASLPESELEIGGEDGHRVLETIEHTFGRMETIWKPVAANEGFEVVRRRLFSKPKDLDALDQVCRSFSEMYQQNTTDFPPECREAEYLERMKSCYPIHPEVFDRLYIDWATLDRFQRTRGVLRLMAAVIHELWMRQDNSLMIMPGTFTLDTPQVRNEMTRYIPETWNAVIESEVDGKQSAPSTLERENPRFALRLAARRVTRTIFVGSAPSVREQRVRGIELSRILLGCMQPGDNVSLFGDVLSHLRNKLTYLFSDSSNNRYWFDTRPTLRKLVSDRANQYSPSEVEMEIENRMKVLCPRDRFVGVHVCPSSSMNVPDEQCARLVVLPPTHTFKTGTEACKAIVYAEEILLNRGTSPRTHRNMLAFIAADANLLADLQEEVRRFIAWRSIIEDKIVLNLDPAQTKEAEEEQKRSDSTVRARLIETYQWLLSPVQHGTDPREWTRNKIGGDAESISKKAYSRLLQDEGIIERWSPFLLKAEMDQWLWRDSNHLSIKDLWRCLTSYWYMSRLHDYNVLLNTIVAGLQSKEYFAYADGFDGNRYSGLKIGEGAGGVNEFGYLVKVDVAQRQITVETPKPGVGTGDTPPTPPSRGNGVGFGPAPEPIPPLPPPPGLKKKKRFHAAIHLDTDRISLRIGRINDEILQHLVNLKGADVEVTLEISIRVNDGIPDEVVRIVSENAKTLKVDGVEFEEE